MINGPLVHERRETEECPEYFLSPIVVLHYIDCADVSLVLFSLLAVAAVVVAAMVVTVLRH